MSSASSGWISSGDSHQKRQQQYFLQHESLHLSPRSLQQQQQHWQQHKYVMQRDIDATHPANPRQNLTILFEHQNRCGYSPCSCFAFSSKALISTGSGI
mmetsp:Transcript_11419/g.18592  ORF Transcript_11419/g.18592 Transcript_11419/m.18592 type:complete len:99 (+) Transcript_11419:406-702(+)